MRSLGAAGLLLLLLGAAARAAGPDELILDHGELDGRQRAAALHVLRSHYRDFLDTMGALRLSGLDKKDPGLAAVCAIDFSSGTAADYPAGTFVDGLPTRRGSPAVFVVFQQQLVEKVLACSARMYLTRKTMLDAWRAYETYARLVSGTTYCVRDDDCWAERDEGDPSILPEPMTVLGSERGNLVLVVATARFMPGFFTMLQSSVLSSIQELGSAHPDYARFTSQPRTLFPRWRHRKLDAACVERMCRVKGS